MKAYSAIDRLPELPVEALELGGELDFAETEPVLTIIPLKTAPPDRGKPSAVAKERSEHYVRKYLTQVTYPKLWCYPPNELVARNLSTVLERSREPLPEHERDPLAVANHEAYYKLSSHAGAPLAPPWFCRVHYGPWSAVAVEQQACHLQLPSRWTLVVPVADLILIWDGLWEDLPPYPNLQVIMGDLYLRDEAWLCCPGYVWCSTTNACIPVQVPCQGPGQL